MSKKLLIISGVLACSMLSGCISTAPKLGGGKGGGTITGSAGGESSQNKNSKLATCSETLGTVTVFEDRSLPWWSIYKRRAPSFREYNPCHTPYDSAVKLLCNC